MKVNISPYVRANWQGPPRVRQRWAFVAGDGRGKALDRKDVIWSPDGLHLDEAIEWLKVEKPEFVEVLVVPVQSPSRKDIL